MARLSAENFNTPNTSQPHKTSRLRGMFKSPLSRSSLSPGSTVESPEHSPRSIENVKPGYEKVGLHPSERFPILGRRQKSRDKRVGNSTQSPEELMAQQAEELKDMKVPHELDTGLEASGVRHTDTIDEQEKEVEPLSSKQSVPVNHEQVGGTVDPEVHIQGGGQEQTPEEDVTSGKVTRELLDEAEPALTQTQSLASADVRNAVIDKGECGTPADYTMGTCNDWPHNSEGRDKVEKNDQLNLKQQALFSPKDATEISQGSGQKEDPISHALCERIHSHDLNGASKQQGVDDTADIGGDSATHPLTERAALARSVASTKIGPFYIIDPKFASSTKIIVSHLYMISLLGAALLGPGTFILSVWRMSVLLFMHAIACRQFEWYDENAPDALLQPIKNGLVVMEDVSLEIFAGMLEVLAPLIATAVHRVNEEYERLKDN